MKLISLENCFSLFILIFADSILIEGVEYTEFIDLDLEDGGVLGSVLPDAQGLETGDYFSSPIYVDQGIPIGARAELTTVLYVLSDGAIAFDRPIALNQPLTFPLEGSLADLQLVTPFLADHDPRQFGSVRYKVYSGSTDNTKLVSQFIRNRNHSSNFAGSWMLVAEWSQVPLYSAVMTDPNITNTYQAVIISDGAETFTVFTYNCDQLQWTGEVGSYATIGFNVLGDVEDFRNFENFGLSRLPQVGMVACTNQENNRPWTNLIYKIGTVVNQEQVQRSVCLSRIAGDQEKISLPPNTENSLQNPFVRIGFGLVDCPCSFLQATRDSRFSVLESTNNICFISKFPVLVEDISLFLRCCYSSINFALASDEDQEGYGSVVLMSTSSSLETVIAETTGLQSSCCGRVGLCNLFYQRRPSSDCAAYQPQIYSWGLGDPHFTTLDGAQYTFNGWGEYVLLNARNFTFQGRTKAVDASLEGSATQFSAFAFGIPDAVVEIRLDSGDLQLLLNNTDITNTVATVNQTNSDSPLVFFERTADNTIQTAFTNNIGLSVSSSLGLLSFVATIPEAFEGETQGLLGNFNQNSTDDFIFRDGTMLSVNASDSEIHDFGQSWQILPEESLFSYPVGNSSQDFSFPDHSPLFTDEVVANASDEILKMCGDDVRCIFDASQTGNLDIGLDTMQTDDTIDENRDFSNNNPPNITGPDSLMVVLNEASQFMIEVMDTNLVSLNISSGVVEGGQLSVDSESDDITTYIFSWTPTSVIDDPIVFVATDSFGATSQYMPQIQFCPCMNDGSCTLGGILDLTANPITLNCDCSTATGYEGRYCETDIDGCAELACFTVNGCIDIPAPGVGANCSNCPPGFTGDGRKCTDLNECLGEGNGNTCVQQCINSAGGYNCSCFSGYVPTSPTECEDIDECLILNGGCHQVCNNTEGARNCSCDEGFQLMEDAINCQVIASLECNNETTNCTQNCLRDEITEMDICSCEIGFVLNDSDLFTCDDVDECEFQPCNHTCENTVGSFQCACNVGFAIDQDGRSCTDIDECVVAALAGDEACMDASMLCVNTIGSFACVCPRNTELLNGECREPVTTTLATTPQPTTIFDTTTPEVTPGATTTQAVTSDETEPETETPQATTSQTTMPDATTLGATTMQGSTPEATQPETSTTRETPQATTPQATMPEASTQESTSSQTFETTTLETVTVLPQVVRENAVTVTLASMSAAMFTEERQQMFIDITVMAINSYCEDTQNLCGNVDVPIAKRQASQISPENVIITNIRNNARLGVDFDMYITTSQTQLLNQQALLNAIVEMASTYRDAGFNVFFRAVVPKTEPTVASNRVISPGIVVLIMIALVALTILAFIIALLCYIYRLRRYGKVVFKNPSRIPPKKLNNMEHGTLQESVVVTNTAARSAEDAESVHSYRLEFFGSHEESGNFDKMEMVNSDVSGGEIKVSHAAIEAQNEEEKVTSF